MLCPHCRVETTAVPSPKGVVRCAMCMRVIQPEAPSADLADLPEVLPAEEAEGEAAPAGRASPERARPGRGTKANAQLGRVATGYVRHTLAKFLVLILFAPCARVGLILIQAEQAIPYHGSGPEPQGISCRDLLARG